MTSTVLRDSAGRERAYEDVRKQARDYIVRHGSIHEIVDGYLDSLTDSELLEWVIEPDGSGLFAEPRRDL